MSAETVQEQPRATPWPVPALRAPELYAQLTAAVAGLETPTPCGEPDAGDAWLPDPGRGGGAAQALAEAVATAVEGCSRCPVLTECRDYAVAARESYGVWGGLDMGAPKKHGRRRAP